MTKARDIANSTTTLDVDGTIKLDGSYPVGSNNVALGNDAFSSNVSGAQNTAIGERALNASTTTSWNTAVGYKSSFSNTSGTNLTSVGSESLILNTTGNDNTALGTNTLYYNTTGSYNTALGMSALQNNTTANVNTAVGYQAAFSNTTGASNTAIGQGALYSNTTGASVAGVGREVLYNNTTGQNNSALGFQAMSNNTTGSYNIAIGSRSLNLNATASNNTAVGYQAGYSKSADIGSTFLGYRAGYNNISGSYNTFVGADSGYAMTTGAKNTILGVYNGNQGGLDIRTSSNNIVLSDGDGNPRLRITNSNDLITGPSTSSAGLTVWNTSGGLEEYRATTNTGFGVTHFYSDVGGTRAFKAYVAASGAYNNLSDYRIKENVTELTNATDRIKAMRPISYNEIGSDEHQEGFIAHELQQVIPHVVTGEKDQLKEDGSAFLQSVHYTGLIATLTAALKESVERIEQLEADVAELKGQP